MDVIHGEDEVSLSSLILSSINSQQKEVVSPEDLAWADSCLIQDNDILESTWNPLQNALLEIISSTPESFNADGAADIGILPSTKENKNASFQGTGSDFSPVSIAAERSTDGIEDNNMAYTMPSSSFQDNLTPFSEGNMQMTKHIDTEDPSMSSSTYNVIPVSVATANTDDINNNEKTETLPSLVFQGNPFLPTYSEDLKDNETVDSGLNLDYSLAYDMEQSSDDIFKIWDLNIPSEEDELVEQWKKALGKNSFQMMPSSSNDSEQLEVLDQGSLDDLIADIADLSLN